MIFITVKLPTQGSNAKTDDSSFYLLPLEDLYQNLQSDPSHGLNKIDVQNKQSHYGKNQLPEPPKKSLIRVFFQQFLSPLIYLLIIAAGISIFIGEARDAYVILVVLILNALIGALQEDRAERSMRALKKLSEFHTRVLRCGKEEIIDSREVVPGDILILNAGDAVPADARLIEIISLSASEAALTGESTPVTKNCLNIEIEGPLSERFNMIFAGTFITTGKAKAIVVATGLQNEIGKIAKLTATTLPPKTNLELQIQEFGRRLLYASGLIFVLVIFIGLLRGNSFAEIFMIAMSQIVSLVPEGLPVAITIALAVGVHRMSKRKTIVRKLSAVESLGSTTLICTDKTGTLTRNEIVVTNIYLPSNNTHLLITGEGYSPQGDIFESPSLDSNIKTPFQAHSNKNFQTLIEAITLCNDAQLISPKAPSDQWKIIGDPTEGAMLVLAEKAGVATSEMRKNFPRKAELPFSSEAKLMATQNIIHGKNIVFLKGAPESLLPMCSSELDHDKRLSQLDVAHQMASKALRVLAVGYVEDAIIQEDQGFSLFKNKVTFLGLIGEIDPPRQEVSQAIQDCQSAGIKTVMITGDHKTTGLAIANTLGLLNKNSLSSSAHLQHCLDGQELDRLSEEELLERIDSINVFARVHPTQKLRIVQSFQAKGHTVAMTGDGVNDAPALVSANVGVAMGMTGTDVAKEAAKIIITDDNFSTLVAAIAEGRLVYQNIKKLILFLFVTSIDEVVVLLLALISGFPLPLTAVQILWINLVTEGTLTINLVMEAMEGDEMKMPPASNRATLIDKSLLKRMPLMVLSSVAATFGWFLYLNFNGVSVQQIQTETFTMLAVCQWFNLLNCRSSTQSVFKLTLFKNNLWLLGGLIFANLLQIAVIYWKPLAQFFNTVPIPLTHVLVIGCIASIVLWTEELRKKFFKKKLKVVHS